MRTRLRVSLALIAGLAGPAAAQEPLSAIDWLRRNPPPGTHTVRPPETPVTETAISPEVTVTPLDDSPVAVGLVPATVTGLPVTLWQASSVSTLTRLIRDAPVRGNPAMQSLLYSLLLAEALPPTDPGADETLLLARLDRLMSLGAVEPSQALVRQAGVAATAERFSRWFDAALLTGTEDAACATLTVQPSLAKSYAPRIFCAARRGDWPAAALMLDSARALDLLDANTGELLDRFLHPEYYDGAAPLPAPINPAPLTFRLYEAIGEALPTAPLPRAFAHADLRDVAGWKAQLEAAERLTRTGALGPNRLLGIFTSGRPAASGGIWDRVAAMQRFETALGTGSGEAIRRTLPPAWEAARHGGIETAFSDLFGDRLGAAPASDTETARLIFRIRMLSPAYEIAARNAPKGDPEAGFLASIAVGEIDAPPTGDARAIAIATGFANPAPQDTREALSAGRLGEVLLHAIAAFDRGARGNTRELTDAIATLRAVGMEDIARRAALNLLLLEHRS